MGISVNIQNISRAKARRITQKFSTVDLFCDKDREIEGWRGEISIYLEGPGHEDAAARIAALINEQVIRRDRPASLPYENSATIPHDDGPTYDGPDDENEALRVETEQNVEYNRAYIEHLNIKQEEAAYNEEDRLGREAHARAVRRDDKPWTPHEDQIEEDVRAGRRDVDGEPI